jgi:hypothetical protein
MTRVPIAIQTFVTKPIHLWDIQWLLLTSGDFSRNSFNAMTVGWGSLGYMWRKPFVQVVVRPVRYTYEFIEKYDTFTLCAFPKKFHSAMQLLGTKSGRNGDKISESGLTPMASTMISAPGYAEAMMYARRIFSIQKLKSTIHKKITTGSISARL